MTSFIPFPLNIMFPGAAGNMQSFESRAFSPTYTFNFAGNAEIEREVTEDVATYGRQIGWLNDIVLALAKAAPDSLKDDSATGSLKQLKDAMAKIEAIKERRASSAYDQARSALETLAKTDKAELSRLLRTFDGPQAKA
ncbi:MAG TPA: hypothetical protein VNR39_05830 [Pseudolabrys sp.]|nr:hypothetical protein [Pseudolabrys sp.]